MEKMTFGIFHKTHEQKMRAANKALECGITVRKWKTSLHDAFACVSDDEDIPKELLADVVTTTLNQHRQYVKLMLFSEAVVFGESWNPLKTMGPGLRFEFVLLPIDKVSAKEGGGERSQEAKLQVAQMLFVVAMRYVDKVAHHKLSPACRERLKKVAAKKEEIDFKKHQAKRDRAAQERKTDKIQKEKAALAAKSPEELAKYEEKMAKKAKKGGVRMKMM